MPRMPTGVMVALYLHPDDAKALGESARTKFADNAESADNLHITLGYYGDANEITARETGAEQIATLHRLAKVMSEMWCSEITLSGITRFYTPASKAQEEGDPVVALVDSYVVRAMRTILENDVSAPYPRSDHDFTPHITLAYVPHEKAISVGGNDPTTIRVAGVRVAVAGANTDYPFEDMSEYMISGPTSVPINGKPIRLSLPMEDVEALPYDAFAYTSKTGARMLPYSDGAGTVIEPWAHNARIVAQYLSLGDEATHVKELLDPPVAKAGKRMRDAMLSKLREAATTISDLLKWGGYDDTESDPTPDEKAIDSESTFVVFKDAKGADRWLSYSSNGFRDREDEIVTTRSLEETVKYADETGERGPLLLFHIEPTEIGVCDFQAVEERFLIESGTFLENELAKAFLDNCDKYPEPLGTSIGFITDTKAYDDKDRSHERIRIVERSVLPLKYAANPYTGFVVERGSMDPRKFDFLKAVVGDTLAEHVVAGAATRTRELEASVDYKSIVKLEPDPVKEGSLDETAIKALVTGLTADQPIGEDTLKNLRTLAGVPEPPITPPDPQEALVKAITDALGGRLELIETTVAAIGERVMAVEAKATAAPPAPVVEAKEADPPPRAAQVFRAASGVEVSLDRLAKTGLKVPDANGNGASPVAEYLGDLAVMNGRV